MLNQYELTDDPFPIVPDGPVHNWAGRADLQEELVDLVKGVRGRDIGVTEFVVLHGEYGAGKSHALRYLKTRIEEQSKKEEGEFRSLALYVERPRVATKLNFLELYKYVVRMLGRDRVLDYAKAVREYVNGIANEKAAAAGLGQLKVQDSFKEAAISECKVTDQPMVRLLVRAAEDGSKFFDFLVGNEKCDGEEYEGKIDSDFLAAKVLSDFIRVLTYEFKPKKSVLESVYLFIDEGEMLVEVKASESELVFNGLRELINGLPYRFGLIISFSAATALIEAVMPQHLLKRTTRPYVEVPMLTDDEALDFLKTQINFYRPPGSPKAGTFYPFTEDAIKLIVEAITTLTPRNLFIDCKRVLERAIRRFGVQPGQEISKDIAQKILSGVKA